MHSTHLYAAREKTALPLEENVFSAVSGRSALSGRWEVLFVGLEQLYTGTAHNGRRLALCGVKRQGLQMRQSGAFVHFIGSYRNWEFLAW